MPLDKPQLGKYLSNYNKKPCLQYQEIKFFKDLNLYLSSMVNSSLFRIFTSLLTQPFTYVLKSGLVRNLN